MTHDHWTHKALNYTLKIQKLEIFTFQGRNMDFNSVQVRDSQVEFGCTALLKGTEVVIYNYIKSGHKLS